MRNIRELIVLCATFGACTYDFPDPYDAEVFACEANDDCADGFNCVNGTCLDEATFGDIIVTVEGMVQAPAERVFTYVADRELSTPVQPGGLYALEVPMGKIESVVALYSRGPSGAASAGVELASVLGDAPSLLAAAGPTRRIGAAQHPGVNLTPFTTMMFGGVCAAAGERVPSTRAELIRAEQAVEAELTYAQMLEGAAVLSSIVASGGPIPNGFGSTLALACTPAGMRAVVNDIRTAAAPADPIGTEIAKMVADTAVTARFERTRLPSSYSEVLKSRRGFIGSANGRLRLVLDPSGSGTYQAGWELMGAVAPLSQTTWLVNAQGELDVSVTSPVPESTSMGGPEIAAHYTDVTTQTAIISALGEGWVDVDVSTIGIQAVLLARGTAADWTAVTMIRRYGFKAALEPFQVSVADVVEAVPAESRLWLRSDAITPIAWPGGSPAGSTWAVRVVLPSDRASTFGDWDVGTPAETAVLMRFEANGTATASGGVLTVPTGYTWQQLGDGTIALTTPAGWQERIALWDAQGPEYGMFTWYPSNLGSEYQTYGPVVQRDPSLAPTLSMVVNAPGEYWMSGINKAWYPPETGDEIPVDGWFGFEFRSDGTVYRRYTSFNGATNRYEWLVDIWHARAEGLELVIEARRDQYGSFSTCIPGGEDRSCFVERWRKLLPVAAPDGRLYALEANGMLQSYWDLQWDSISQQWLSWDGTPADLSNFGYPYLPRMNVYLRTPIQAIP